MFDSGGRRPQIIVRTRRRVVFSTTGLVPFASLPQLAQRDTELAPDWTLLIIRTEMDG